MTMKEPNKMNLSEAEVLERVEHENRLDAPSTWSALEAALIGDVAPDKPTKA